MEILRQNSTETFKPNKSDLVKQFLYPLVHLTGQRLAILGHIKNIQPFWHFDWI